ncbi:hypothetical protein F4779DRAFT_192028 [Xylariaceae sp. FL0662B]|nr:hypothetical protein F4779DRAFT_192028 [Xylariaceae sp. FL0662B]
MKAAFFSTLITSFLAATATAGVTPVRTSPSPSPISFLKATTNNPPQVARDSDEYQAFQHQVRSLPRHKRGYMSLGSDGVMRSLGPRHEVLGFVAASPEVLARRVADKEDPVERRALESAFAGVDGRDVADPWVLKREVMAPGAAALETRGDEVLDARDIVVRDLLGKRTCATRDKGCTFNSDCGNDCDCDHEHLSTNGNCKDD